MALVSDTKRRQSPRVAHVLIEGDRVGLDRQAGARSQNINSPGVVLADRFLESRAPAWSVRGEGIQSESNWKKDQTAVNPTTSIETAHRIGVVEVLHRTCDLNAFELVNRLLECPQSKGGVIQHEELA